MALLLPCLAAVLVAAPCLHAQQSAAAPVSQALPSTTPLAITISPAPVPAGEAPLFVTITLTNTSDRDIRLPEPEIGCSNPHSGSVVIETQLAAPSETGDGQSAVICSTDMILSPAEAAADTDNPAAHWLTLAPGDTANFAQRIPPADTAGKIILKGTYTPPEISSAAKERLYSLGVTYPTEPLTSAPVTVRGHAAALTTASLFQ